jgi:hypothetical protein
LRIEDAYMADEKQPGNDAEIDKLAAAAKEVYVADAVVGLQGNFIEFFARETAAYKEHAGDAWTDDGLAKWIAAREAEMQRAWRTDVNELTGDETLKPR